MNKPNYSFDFELFCGVIEYNNKKYYMDINDQYSIINYPKNFTFQNDTDLYPTFNYNEQKINYLLFLYNFKEINVKYIFKNGNPLDLRRCNVEYYHLYHDQIIEKYQVLEYIPGHYSKHGVDPYNMKNPLWKIKENEKEYLLMYCEKDTICKLCVESYQKIVDYEIEKNDGKKITWFKLANGYINGTIQIYMHQIITGCYGNGKGTKEISVDHIDQDPLNNSLENLRIANRKEQEQNCKGIKENTKRERKHSAKPLPEGITQGMMKKYVVYYHEWLNPEKTKFREYFKIEKHPKLEKIWVGTKSNKISILDKLEIANKMSEGLGV